MSTVLLLALGLLADRLQVDGGNEMNIFIKGQGRRQYPRIKSSVNNPIGRYTLVVQPHAPVIGHLNQSSVSHTFSEGENRRVE